MITISQVVDHYLQHTPYIEQSLEQDLINLSSLARLLQPEIEKKLQKKIKLGAILMDLKRKKRKLIEDLNGLENALKELGDISVRSNLIEFTFVNSDTLKYKHAKLLANIDNNKNVFLTVTHGVFETTLFGSESLADKIAKIFKGEECLAILRNLSSITIRLPKSTIRIPGIHYAILKQLAWENINVIDSVSTYTEFTIVLDKSDVDRAFSVLNKYLGNKSII